MADVRLLSPRVVPLSSPLSGPLGELPTEVLLLIRDILLLPSPSTLSSPSSVLALASTCAGIRFLFDDATERELLSRHAAATLPPLPWTSWTFSAHIEQEAREARAVRLLRDTLTCGATANHRTMLRALNKDVAPLGRIRSALSGCVLRVACATTSHTAFAAVWSREELILRIVKLEVGAPPSDVGEVQVDADPEFDPPEWTAYILLACSPSGDAVAAASLPGEDDLHVWRCGGGGEQQQQQQQQQQHLALSVEDLVKSNRPAYALDVFFESDLRLVMTWSDAMTTNYVSTTRMGLSETPPLRAVSHNVVFHSNSATSSVVHAATHRSVAAYLGSDISESNSPGRVTVVRLGADVCETDAFDHTLDNARILGAALSPRGDVVALLANRVDDVAFLRVARVGKWGLTDLRDVDLCPGTTMECNSSMGACFSPTGRFLLVAPLFSRYHTMDDDDFEPTAFAFDVSPRAANGGFLVSETAVPILPYALPHQFAWAGPRGDLLAASEADGEFSGVLELSPSA